MALSDHQIKLLGEAAKLLNLEIAGISNIFSGSGEVADWHDLETFVLGNSLDLELQENVVHADALLADAANAFADFHRAAADGGVNPPSDDQINTFKEKLRELHTHVASDQAFAAGAAFACSPAGSAAHRCFDGTRTSRQGKWRWVADDG